MSVTRLGGGGGGEGRARLGSHRSGTWRFT
jgi:hypothetical protein